MNTILCVFCAVEMLPKTVFGKDYYSCPKCGRRVPASDVVTLPDPSTKTVAITAPLDGAATTAQPIVVTVEDPSRPRGSIL